MAGGDLAGGEQQTLVAINAKADGECGFSCFDRLAGGEEGGGRLVQPEMAAALLLAGGHRQDAGTTGGIKDQFSGSGRAVEADLLTQLKDGQPQLLLTVIGGFHGEFSDGLRAWVGTACLHQGTVGPLTGFWVSMAYGVAVLNVVVEVHPAHKGRRTAGDRIDGPVRKQPIPAKDPGQGGAHHRDLAAAAHQQHRLDLILAIAPITGAVEGLANQAVDAANQIRPIH